MILLAFLCLAAAGLIWLFWPVNDMPGPPEGGGPA